MTKKQQFQKLVNEMNNPEGIPLEFGCEAYMRPGGAGRKQLVTYCSDADYAGVLFKDGSAGSYVEEYMTGEIIGKPLHLEDILRALSGLWGDVTTETQQGYCTIVADEITPEDGLPYWSIAIDIPLDMNLDDKTIDQLTEILKN